MNVPPVNSGVYWGKQIKPFTKKQVLSASKKNELVQCLNPFLNAQVTTGNSNAVYISEGRAIFQFKVT